MDFIWFNWRSNPQTAEWLKFKEFFIKRFYSTYCCKNCLQCFNVTIHGDHLTFGPISCGIWKRFWDLDVRFSFTSSQVCCDHLCRCESREDFEDYLWLSRADSTVAITSSCHDDDDDDDDDCPRCLKVHSWLRHRDNICQVFLSPVLLVTSWLNFYSANCVKSNFWFYISCTSDVYFSTQYISLLVWKRLFNFWWFRVVVVVVYQARKIDLFCCFFFYSLLYFMAHCFFLFLVGCCIWRVGWLPLCLIAAPPYITFPVWFDRSTYWTSTCYFL